MDKLSSTVRGWDLKTLASSSLKVLVGAGALALFLHSGGTLPVAAFLVALSAIYAKATGQELSSSPVWSAVDLASGLGGPALNRGLAILGE